MKHTHPSSQPGTVHRQRWLHLSLWLSTCLLWGCKNDKDPAADSMSEHTALRWVETTPSAPEWHLPPGTVTYADDTYAHVWPVGLFLHDGTDASEGLENPLLSTLNPRATPVAQDIEQGWMASAGGLFKTDDGLQWEAVNTAATGDINVLFTGVDVDEDRVAAVAMVPESIIPSDYSGLLGGTLFVSEDAGESFESIETESLLPTSVAIAGDKRWIGTMDQGVLGIEGGPSDVVAVEWWQDHLLVGSASRGLWIWDGADWTQAGDGAVQRIQDGRAWMNDSTQWTVEAGEGESAEETGGARVFVALSFHVNYYHSYRGDEPTDDGFGLDIDVIRNTLDWLDAHPQVHADWDSDNAFTTDDWMVEHSPDILERIAARVAAGTDDVRLMSWNNGAMAASNKEEFTRAVERAFESNEAAFGRVVNGVQPQECMFTPDHLAWYPELGVEWVTLFYSATAFTALRSDLELSGDALHNPFTLTRDGASMTAVPVYHHADVLDHGGLSGWVRQLNASQTEDQLLVVHFDADAETWENFDTELTALEEMDFVEFTTIQRYLDDHDPVESHALPGDVADGNGDGFSSWAGKHFNHEISTLVAQSRDRAAQATLLGADADLIAQSLEARLLALSTTNYGLAAPLLHDDRIESATTFATDALAAAQSALDGLEEPAAGTLELVNPRQSEGPAMVQFTAPSKEDITVHQDGAELPQSRDGDQIRVVAQVTAESVTTLQWQAGTPKTATPPDSDLPSPQAPFTECDGEQAIGIETGTDSGADDLMRWESVSWDLSACEHDGTVEWHFESYAGIDGTVVRVTGHFEGDEPDTALESVAPFPLACEAPTTLRWRSWGGNVWDRPVRSPVLGWNGQAADGWVALDCADSELVVAHRLETWTSIGPAPLRYDGLTATLAPLGTLWDPGPWHNGRRTGGHGIGELVTFAVGAQFRPQAPDWVGNAYEMLLLVGDEGIDEDTLDLFAHPPLVRVGH